MIVTTSRGSIGASILPILAQQEQTQLPLPAPSAQ
jgi:hypothetical protein